MEVDNQKEQKENQWVENLTALLESYRNLIALKLVSHVSMGASIGIVTAMSVLLVILVVIFTGIGFAWWLGEELQNMKAGFFLVGAAYSLFFLIITVSRKWLVSQIRDAVIKSIYDHDKNL